MRRLLAVAALVATVGVGSAHSASSPYDHLSDPPFNPDVPRCLAEAPNTSAPSICKVLPFNLPSWQAEAGEWILIRTGFPATDCGLLAAIDATYTLDGKELAVDPSDCVLQTDDLWFVDFRALSPPLAPGDHAISTTFAFPSGLGGGSVTYTTTLSVTAGETGVTSTTIRDSFAGKAINGNVWGWHGTNDPGDVTIAQNGGVVTVDVAATAQDDFNAALGTRCKAHGDFEAELGFRLAEWPAVNGVWVSLNTSNTDGFNTYRVSWHFQGGEEYGTYLPPSGGGTVPATDTEGVLRLTREGSVWTGYHKAHGGWVEIASGEGPTYDIEFNAGVFNVANVLPFGGQAATVEFSDFKVVADGIVCP